jgi:hypothetical protein
MGEVPLKLSEGRLRFVSGGPIERLIVNCHFLENFWSEFKYNGWFLAIFAEMVGHVTCRGQK